MLLQKVKNEILESIYEGKHDAATLSCGFTLDAHVDKEYVIKTVGDGVTESQTAFEVTTIFKIHSLCLSLSDEPVYEFSPSELQELENNLNP